MSLLTESTVMYGIPEKEPERRKYDLIPHCKYNDGVACEEKGRGCKTCGWNPVVSEMRKQAIELGDKHFLRLADRDFDSIEEIFAAVRENATAQTV